MTQSRQDRNEEVKTVCLSLGLEEVLRYKVQGERVLQSIGLGLRLELALLIFLNIHRHSVWVQTRSREAIGHTAFMPITCHCHLVTPPPRAGQRATSNLLVLQCLASLSTTGELDTGNASAAMFPFPFTPVAEGHHQRAKPCYRTVQQSEIITH